jgi:hypothetical protein
MRFQPPSEAEIEARKLWPKGVYPFEIFDAEEKLSASKGNPMIELKVKLGRRDGATRIVKDYLMVQRPEKLMNAAKACGVIEKYHAGLLAADDFVGKCGSNTTNLTAVVREKYETERTNQQALKQTTK